MDAEKLKKAVAVLDDPKSPWTERLGAVRVIESEIRSTASWAGTARGKRLDELSYPGFAEDYARISEKFKAEIGICNSVAPMSPILF
ncbi:MAG: hypothetical protein HQM09_23430 [Candidatus Riflebacteria bacterium]|nr:hypothetical protein [Candidatus Riflebacteria bacterium]